MEPRIFCENYRNGGFFIPQKNTGWKIKNLQKPHLEKRTHRLNHKPEPNHDDGDVQEEEEE